MVASAQGHITILNVFFTSASLDEETAPRRTEMDMLEAEGTNDMVSP